MEEKGSLTIVQSWAIRLFGLDHWAHDCWHTTQQQEEKINRLGVEAADTLQKMSGERDKFQSIAIQNRDKLVAIRGYLHTVIDAEQIHDVLASVKYVIEQRDDRINSLEKKYNEPPVQKNDSGSPIIGLQ